MSKGGENINPYGAKDILFTLKQIKDDPNELSAALAQAEARLSDKDRKDVIEKYNEWKLKANK
ncbi:MAG: hypothetical protein FWG45_06135 [Oscillospiraceae bacterium]|nr:hypothetical protein [Oscillospiraceae bacterium]